MVEVSQHYALESDGERNYTILRKVVSKKDGSVSYARLAYYNNLQDALKSIFKKETKKWLESKDGKEMRKIASDLMEHQEKLMHQMVDAVKEASL